MSTNTNPVSQKLERYLNQYTPLHQVFLVDALIKVSKAVVSHQEEMKESMKDHPVHPEAWIKCAQDALEEFKEYNK
jgi:hypothetical protein